MLMYLFWQGHLQQGISKQREVAEKRSKGEGPTFVNPSLRGLTYSRVQSRTELREIVEAKVKVFYLPV